MKYSLWFAWQCRWIAHDWFIDIHCNSFDPYLVEQWCWNIEFCWTKAVQSSKQFIPFHFSIVRWYEDKSKSISVILDCAAIINSYFSIKMKLTVFFSVLLFLLPRSKGFFYTVERAALFQSNQIPIRNMNFRLQNAKCWSSKKNISEIFINRIYLKRNEKNWKSLINAHWMRETEWDNIKIFTMLKW